jgi:hypothetical protein
MSELLNTQKRHEGFRHNLLTNVSMLALLSYIAASVQSAFGTPADDAPPTIWIEVGGQADRMDRASDVLAPPFVGKATSADRDSMIQAQKLPPFSIGGEAKVSFKPHDSNWILSASVRYGRADGGAHLHHQTPNRYVKQYIYAALISQPRNEQFGDGQIDFKESHFIADFRAGKDVGLGLFGAGGTSIVSAGVRFAQFVTGSDVSLHGREYKLGALHSETFNGGQVLFRSYDHFKHTYTALLHTQRNATPSDHPFPGMLHYQLREITRT